MMKDYQIHYRAASFAMVLVIVFLVIAILFKPSGDKKNDKLEQRQQTLTTDNYQSAIALLKQQDEQKRKQLLIKQKTELFYGQKDISARLSVYRPEYFEYLWQNRQQLGSALIEVRSKLPQQMHIELAMLRGTNCSIAISSNGVIYWLSGHIKQDIELIKSSIYKVKNQLDILAMMDKFSTNWQDIYSSKGWALSIDNDVISNANIIAKLLRSIYDVLPVVKSNKDICFSIAIFERFGFRYARSSWDTAVLFGVNLDVNKAVSQNLHFLLGKLELLKWGKNIDQVAQCMVDTLNKRGFNLLTPTLQLKGKSRVSFSHGSTSYAIVSGCQYLLTLPRDSVRFFSDKSVPVVIGAENFVGPGYLVVNYDQPRKEFLKFIRRRDLP